MLQGVGQKKRFEVSTDLSPVLCRDVDDIVCLSPRTSREQVASGGSGMASQEAVRAVHAIARMSSPAE